MVVFFKKEELGINNFYEVMQNLIYKNILNYLALRQEQVMI